MTSHAPQSGPDTKSRLLRFFDTRRKIYLAHIIIILGGLVFVPGLSGPFIFDDFQNIVLNQFLKLDSLDSDSILAAALSNNSGPLGRPVSMVSFALNNYFYSSVAPAFVFKSTNLVIHVLNGFSVFWFVYLLIRCHSLVLARSDSPDVIPTQSLALWFAGATAALWVAHPVQTTSVLYVVQRMTSLSATFSILALVSYLWGRRRFIETSSLSITYTIIIPSILIIFSILAKETGLLLPLYILVIEVTIFRNHLWNIFSRISNRQIKFFVVFLSIVSLAIAAYFVILYANAGYSSRPFSMTERLLTEARIVSYYIYILLLPIISNFSLHHDYFPISTSIISPWTTLASILFLLALFVTALRLKNRHPIVTFGILWFFIGHSLESTLFALEIAHEHRNYLPSVGLLLVLVYSVSTLGTATRSKNVLLIIPLLIVLFSGVTLLRSHQWRSNSSLYSFEILHHPDSPRLQIEFSNVLATRGHYSHAIDSARTASKLAPYEPAYLIEILYLQSLSDSPLDDMISSDILALLNVAPLSSFLTNQIGVISKCIDSSCKSLDPLYRDWLISLTKRNIGNKDRSYFFYLLGKHHIIHNELEQAVKLLGRSYSLDNSFIHPLFSLASIYVNTGNVSNAETMLNLIQVVNKKYYYRWQKQIELLKNDILKMKTTNQQ